MKVKKETILTLTELERIVVTVALGKISQSQLEDRGVDPVKAFGAARRMHNQLIEEHADEI